MSVNRCANLLSRSYIRYRVCASTAAVANITNVTLHPTRRTFETLSSRHSSSDSSSRPLDTSLFVPLTVKSDEVSDWAVGEELTQALDRSKDPVIISVMLLIYNRFDPL